MFVQFRGERYGLDHSELVAQSKPRACIVLYAVKTTNNEPLGNSRPHHQFGFGLLYHLRVKHFVMQYCTHFLGRTHKN